MQQTAWSIYAWDFFYFYILMVGLLKIELFALNCNSEILVMWSDGLQAPW